MTMTTTKISKTLLAVVLGSVLAGGSAMAADTAGEKIDSSVKDVGNFMDDSAITAKVKAALVDHDSIKSTDISVKTDKKVVTLSGFVESQAQAEQAVRDLLPDVPATLARLRPTDIALRLSEVTR